MLEIIGDSHVVALSEAVHELGSQADVLARRHGGLSFGYLGHGFEFLQPFFARDGDNIVFDNERMREVFQRVNPKHPAAIQPNDERRFVFVFGLYPSFCFNAEHWKAHTGASWSQDRQFVTKSAFSVIIDHAVQYAMAFFEQLLAMNVKFSVASCCPIPASYQKNVQQDHWADYEVALIYNRFLIHVGSKLDAMGILCHRPPMEVYDDVGAMRDEFARSPKDYHGNAAYGRLMLQKIFTEINHLP
jgi:hypothetical protein